MADNPMPRLLRPQPAAFFPQPDVLAMLDTHNNIVHYRGDLIGNPIVQELLLNPVCKSILFLRDKYIFIAPDTTGPVFSY